MVAAGSRAPLRLAPAVLDRLDVPVGAAPRPGHALRDALLGAAGGLVAGAIFGALSGERGANAGAFVPSNIVRVAVGVGAGLGSLGLLEGIIAPHYTWRRVPLPG